MNQNTKEVLSWMNRNPFIVVSGLLLFLMIALLIGLTSSGSNQQQSTGTSPVAQKEVPVCERPDLKQTAEAVNFKELEKNPDTLKGKVAKFTGEIVEISETEGFGIMRLAVTEASFGWSFSDIVWVEYPRNTSFLKEDVITVYGPLTGSKTYESQAGYQITIPSMIGCVFEKGRGEAKPVSVQSKPTETKTVPQPKPQTTPIPEPVVVTPPTPEVPKSWHRVAFIQGTDDRNTESFNIKGSQWKIIWTANASGQTTYCQKYGCTIYITIRDTSGRYVEQVSNDNIQTTASGESFVYNKTGDFYFDVGQNGLSLWTITVEDYY